MENRCLGLEETRKILKSSYPTVLRMAQRGEIPAFRIGKKWVVPYDQLMRWLEEQAQGTR